MLTIIVLILSALWLLWMGFSLKIKSGGSTGTFFFKVLPTILAFGLSIITFNLF